MYKMIFSLIIGCFFNAQLTIAQQLTFSDIDRQDKADLNFEIIGKMNSNILIYKNTRWKHKITVLDNSMQEVETVFLDFLPEKTFNVDFIAYPNHAFMVYQYQKKNILYCMVVKLDAMGKKLTEPVQIDSTQIPFYADNKIYTTIASENKEKIEIFKLHKKYDNYTLATNLFDKDFKRIHQNRQQLSYDERRDTYTNFLVDNEGNFVFTKETKEGNRGGSNKLSLIQLKNREDTLTFLPINLSTNYIDNVILKIDNLNNRYLFTSFYYKKNRGNIEGVFSTVYNKGEHKISTPTFSVIDDSIRNAAKSNGQIRLALNDFFIQQIVSKKDGGYIVVSEDFSTQNTGGNNSPFNRWDYFNNPYNFNSYYYNPYGGFNRPFNNFNNFNNPQRVRYYYSNILIMSFNKTGIQEWSRVIQKDQYDDETDNFLSYVLAPFNGELHFLFNSDRKNQLIADHSINVNGDIKRNPTLKSREKGHQFMPRLTKQVGAKQLIIPCDYRGFICFAKVDV